MFVQLESRRRSRFPWATWLLTALCVGCFLALSLASPELRLDWIMDWGVVPTRLLDAPWFAPRLAQLFTALFVHADWLHLLSNLLFLLIFGLPAERALGSGRFLLLFLLGGALANLAGAASLAGVRDAIVGCSGSVSAVVGVYLGLFPRARLGVVLPLGAYLEFVRVPALVLIGLWVLLQLLFSWVGAGYGTVVWWTHLAGFAFGLLFAMWSRPALAKRQRRG